MIVVGIVCFGRHFTDLVLVGKVLKQEALSETAPPSAQKGLSPARSVEETRTQTAEVDNGWWMNICGGTFPCRPRDNPLRLYFSVSSYLVQRTGVLQELVIGNVFQGGRLWLFVCHGQVEREQSPAVS